MFNTIGVITKPNDPRSNDKAKELSSLLADKNVAVVHGDEQRAEQADLIIVVGGDGSLLNTARTFVDKKIPILGINLGRLGFLADVPVTNMEEIVNEVLNGNFTQEQRHLLSCQIEQKGEILGQFLALNDAVVHRTETLRMIEFDYLSTINLLAINVLMGLLLPHQLVLPPTPYQVAGLLYILA